MKEYVIHFDTGRPYYADREAHVFADTERQAVDQLKAERKARYDETINVIAVYREW